MSRKLLIISGVVIAVQVAGIVWLGASQAGSWVSNGIQTAAQLIAFAACWGAGERCRGIARSCWRLMASSFLIGAAGYLGYTYFESWLGVTVPSPSLPYFLFACTGAPLLMVLFLGGEDSKFGLPQILDSVQILILFFFLYLYLYYVPYRHAEFRSSFYADQIYVSNFEFWFISAAFLVRAGMTRSALLRGLLRRISVYQVANAAVNSLGSYAAVYWNAASGSWFDLTGTLPVLLLAYLASSYRQPVREALPARTALSFAGILAINLSPAMIPLLVMILAVQVAPEASVVTFATLLASLICFGLRVTVAQVEMRRSHDLLKAVIDGTDDAIYVKDLKGHYLMISSAGARFLGRSVEEVLGKDDTELFSGESGRLLMESDRRVMQSAGIQKFEDSGTVAGVTRTFLSTKGPYRSPSGEVVGLIGISRDISERKQAEEMLQRQMLAMEGAMDGMAILNEKDAFIYLNRAHVKLFGYQSARDLLGKTWRVLYTPEEVARFEQQIFPVVAREGRWAGEAIARRQDGTTFPQELALTSMNGGGLVCVCRDISARKSDEEARIEAETYYRTLVEQLAAITYIARLGAEGEWLFVSPQIESILGYSAAEWLVDSTHWLKHVHPEDRAEVLAAEEACQQGNPFQAEYRMTTRDGRTIWVHDTADVVPGSGGKPPLMHGVILDVTERRHLEERLLQSQKMEAIGRLAGGIAHDFNNLLTIIKGYTDLLRDDLSQSPTVHAKLESIDNAAERAVGLTRQLLAFSRKQILQPQVIDLNAVLRDTEKMLRRLIGEDIEILTFPAADLGAVKVDPSQIEQVIMNLAVNARDAMPRGGKLTLETANADLDETYTSEHTPVRPGRYVVLAVADSGSGIAPEAEAHIFEPFFTTKPRGKGTGLGLSMVYGIVKQSGGYIWVYSEPGHGTTFKVYLPRVEEATAPPRKEKHLAATSRGTETILLVEDDAQLRELASTILSGCGYRVVAVERGDDLDSVCRQHPETIHLLLTDVVMPGISGREVARRITTLRPGIQVVYMSGYTDNAIVHHGVLDPGTLFLQKPFTPSALAEKVREALDRAASNSAA